MRAIDLVTTVIAVRNAIALLYRTDVTTAVVTAYRVIGAALVRRRPQRGLLGLLVVGVRYLRIYRVSRLRREM